MTALSLLSAAICLIGALISFSHRNEGGGLFNMILMAAMVNVAVVSWHGEKMDRRFDAIERMMEETARMESGNG